MVKLRQRKILEVFPYGSNVLVEGIVARIVSVNENNYNKSYCIRNVSINDEGGEQMDLQHLWVNGDEVLKTLDICEPVKFYGDIVSYQRTNGSIDYTVKPTKVITEKENKKEIINDEIISKGEFMLITAKDLFDILGYRQKENDYYFIHYVKRLEDGRYENVSFTRQKYGWSFICNTYDNGKIEPMAVGKNLYKAVSQQLFELESEREEE